jgi:hypothetical protein
MEYECVETMSGFHFRRYYDGVWTSVYADREVDLDDDDQIVFEEKYQEYKKRK